jgi:hypothetical protein
MDEIKRMFAEEPEVAMGEKRALVESLLDDAAYMVERMERRTAEYGEFRERLTAIVADLAGITGVDTAPVGAGIAGIRACLAEAATEPAALTERVHAAAEEIRAVANDQENRLRRFKDAALQLRDAFDEIRGARHWLTGGQSGNAEALRREFQAWLPPEPHAAKLLEFLATDRAVVIGRREEDGQPLVGFEDGGSILMCKVRWNDQVRNFHPQGVDPGATGLQYRG